MITISHVVALSNNNVIGKDNDLPWNLKTDLKHFREYTTNKLLIMGRKTYESIGRPLPNRINYIVSGTISKIEGAKVFRNTQDAIDTAIDQCNLNGKDEIVIIGGGYLFRDTLEVTNKLVLTKVDCNIDGDIFYPKINFSNWEKLSSTNFSKDMDNEYDFVVEEYRRI